jgi:hypothetical protein
MIRRTTWLCVIAALSVGCQSTPPPSATPSQQTTLELRGRMTTDSSFKFQIKIGERTYFRRVGEEAAGFRIVSHERIPNPEPNPKRRYLSTLTMEKNGSTFVLVQGKPHVFTERTGDAQPQPGRYR